MVGCRQVICTINNNHYLMENSSIISKKEGKSFFRTAAGSAETKKCAFIEFILMILLMIPAPVLSAGHLQAGPLYGSQPETTGGRQYSVTEETERVLMVIDNREITGTEFIRLWQKNNQLTEPQSAEEYLDLFINFHLKVAHAREEGIHLEESFREELRGYRKQLARPYMIDPEKEEELVREAWERWKYDVNASHILIRLNPGYSPEDTLMAWEKAMEIRERIEEGESFERVARATSDDPSAKTNSGNLGYFTVFQMVYPFENAVYNAEPGELCMPVRTPFGYHIVKVNDIRESRGEILVSHIMTGFNQYQEDEARQKINEIYNRLREGYRFGELAREHSSDLNTASQGGRLPWFGAGRLIPDFEAAAFALETPGEISKPVRTPYGWHIIRLEEKRSIPPLEEARNELVEKVRNSPDARSRLLRESLVDKLKEIWDYSLNNEALEEFYHIVDDRVFDGNWQVPASYSLDRVLFSVRDRRVTQREFAEFISRNAYKRKPWPIDDYVLSLYDDFAGRWLLSYEEENLDQRHPDFRFLMQEYKDGMLLFEITDREVWQRAVTDSAGLAAFHHENKFEYMWDHRASVTIFTASDSRMARRVARRARRSLRFDSRDDSWVADRLNRGEEEPVVTAERGIFSRGDNELIDNVNWEPGVVETIDQGNLYKTVLVHEIIEPEPKTLEEARGRITADFQDHLERKWLEKLREKYNVTVYRDVLSDITGRY